MALELEFQNKKLESTVQDPKMRISELLKLKERLPVLGVTMTGKDVIIHMLNNLPEEYNNIVEKMEIKLTSTTNPLTLTSVRKRLWSIYARLKQNGVVKKKNDEEMALAAKAFTSFFEYDLTPCTWSKAY